MILTIPTVIYFIGCGIYVGFMLVTYDIVFTLPLIVALPGQFTLVAVMAALVTIALYFIINGPFKTLREFGINVPYCTNKIEYED